MEGWMIYHYADALKNNIYIDMFIAEAKKYNIILKLVLTKDLQLTHKKDDYNTSFRGVRVIPPAFIINRSRDANLAKHFEAQHIRVFNPAIVTEICNDKGSTYKYLAENGISIMDTICYPNEATFQKNYVESIQRLGFPLVIKPADGHGGAHVTLVKNMNEFTDALSKIKADYKYFPKIVMQKCASDRGHDLRVYVLGQTIIAAMMRTKTSVAANEIRSNYSLGGTAALHKLTAEEKAIVMHICRLFPFDLVGIDFVYHKGRPVFNEIEDAVGARMLYAETNIDIVEKYMAYINRFFVEGRG